MIVISKGVSRAYVIILFKVINVMNKNRIDSIISHYNFNKIHHNHMHCKNMEMHICHYLMFLIYTLMYEYEY
jgi:hypothetical protein